MEEIFVFFGEFGVAGGGFSQFGMYFLFIERFGLTGDEVDDARDFFVGYEGALGSDKFTGAGAKIEEVSFTEQVFGA